MAVAHELGEPALEMLVLVAQHLHLPLLQRDRGLAVRVREADRREQLGVPREEFGIGEQVVGDFAIVHVAGAFSYQ